MSTKKKIWFSVGALCLVAVVAVVAIVAVYAATNQTVNSSINVTYRATNVVGTASANVIQYSESAFVKTAMEDGQSGTTLNFSRNDEGTAKTLSPKDDIVLEDATNKDFVVFEYKFTNSSESVKITAGLSYRDGSSDDNNYKVFVHPSATELGVETNWTETINEDKTSSLTNLAENITVPVSGEYYVYVLVKIDNPDNDCVFTGSFAWSLQGTPSES